MDMQTKQCTKCGSEMTYKEGFSQKNNKPYKMWKCQNQNCNEVEFVRDQRPMPQGVKPYRSMPLKSEPNWDEINAKKEESMLFMNAKNNASLLLSASIQKGELNLDDALKLYDRVAKTIYEIGNDNGKNTGTEIPL